MQDVLARHLGLDVVSVETVRVLVHVGAVRWVEAEAVSMRPRLPTQLAKVHRWLAGESSVGQMVAGTVRTGLATGAAVDAARSLRALREVIE